MDAKSIAKILNQSLKVKQTSQTEIEISTPATYPNKSAVNLYVEKVANGFVLNDKKQTLRIMHNIYELKAPDVRNCINAVLRVYGFKLSNGMIFVEIPNETVLEKRVFDMIMCVGQLVNMYAFFDAPDKN